MKKPTLTRVSKTVLGMIAAGFANAGSFSLYTESNGYSIGNFAAGVAAEAYDASTGWYNPAGLALIQQQQALISGVGVLPATPLSGTTQFTSFFNGGTFRYNQSFSNLNGAESALVPAFYYAKPLGENATFGVSVNAPFGLSTNWGDTSPLRYAATLSDLKSLNISPELGGKITHNIAFGAGLDLQYAEVKFNSVLGAPPLLPLGGALATAWDSTSYNKGTSWGGGGHAGVLFLFNQSHTRVGLTYQSRIAHQFHGFSRLTGPLADPVSPYNFNPNIVFENNNLVSNTIEFPDIVTLSGYHDVNEKLALLGSVVFTNWSLFKEIELKNVAAFDESTLKPALVDFVSTEDYRDAWRAAIGANYRFNDKWMLRVGGGYDQTPTVNSQRTVRLPDADRWAISFGGHYQPIRQIVIDAGYTYIQSVSSAAINKTIALGAGNQFTVNATGHPYVNIVGGQIRWNIDTPAKSNYKA